MSSQVLARVWIKLVVSIALIAPGVAQAEWVAYIDHARGPQTAANVTALDLASDDVAHLTNITTGAALPARMVVGRAGQASAAGTMGTPNAGTPAYNVFQGYIDWATALSGNNTILLYGPLSGYEDGIYTLTFTNLDPGKRYTFKGTAVRGGPSSYSNRWTLCVVQGADGFTGAHTSGCITNGDPRVPAGTIANGQVAFCGGMNSAGDMVAWDDISPGSDGTFSIQMQQWVGAIPGGTAGNNYGYALGAMRLEEYSYAAPPQITAPMQDQSSAPGAQVTFTVGAVGSSPMRYYWYSNNVFVAVNDTGSFTSTLYRLASNFVCRVVVSNAFGMATNSAVAYGVIPNPSVTLTAPVMGQQYGAPASVSVQATATAGTGATVRGVGFFTTGGLNLGGAASEPYGVTASLPAVGSYGIYAVVTNSFGLTARSQTNVIAVVAAIDAIIYSGGTYSQNFTNMGSAGTNTPFGWYVGAATGAQGEVSGTNVIVGDGTTSLVASYNLGASGGADRALGSQAGTAAGGDLVMEVRISNNTGSNMLAFGVSYDGEQWRANSASEVPQMLDMYYSIDGSAFVPMPSSFSFTSRVDIGAAALNGNLAANRRAGIGGVYTPAVPVPPGGVVYLRWLDINNGGNDHQLGIDNFSFIVANPVARVEITSPSDGSGFEAPASIPISATTSGFMRAVTNMDFYAGSTFLGRTTAAPYAFTWNNVVSGNYVLRSVATDSGGVRVTSAPVNVSVITPVLPGIPLGQVYDFASGPPASDWSTLSISGGGTTALDPAGLDSIATNMDASAISTALLTASAYTAAGQASWNAAAGTVFTRPTGNGVTLMMATLRNSSGGYVPALNISYTFGGASTTVEEIEGVRAYYSLTGQPGSWTVIPEFSTHTVGTLSAMLVLGAWAPGAPLYLMWADDNGNGSTDGAWFLDDFLAEVTSGEFVAITNPLNNGVVVLPTNLVITATVSGFTNPVTRVTFYSGTSALGFSTSEPYSYTWNGLAPGFYTLRAVALTSTGLSVTSAPSSFTAQNNVAPVIAIGIPANGTVYTAPAEIPIVLAGSDPDGRITNVVFYAGTQKLGENAFAPFGFTWSGVGTGTYDLKLVAYDNHGAAATSSVSRVFVIVSTPPVVSSFTPAPGLVNSLTQVTVTFGEPVDGVDAADLLVGGIPASGVTGSNDVYTFTFPQPVEGSVAVTWAPSTGIYDRENPPKAFTGTSASDTARYTLVDNVAPTVTSISPLPGATLPMLTRVDVTFSEPVAGVDAGSLLINGSPAEGVSGSLAGPYTFEFTQPVSSPVQISWAFNHGIHDLSGRLNALGAATWSYTLDGSGAQTNVVISEIMYHPSPEMPEPIEREWIELHNKGSVAVSLHGWRLSSGMDFGFTNISIPANGYLVVAANLAAFQAQYPGVQNVVGDWEGKLSNNGDTINLRNALDDVVTSVSYASQGDWGRRLRGRGERQVTSLTRSGTTATATVFGHNMRSGDRVRIYGADQSAYNVQDVVVTLVSGAAFTYTISGSPVTPATGVIICRQLTDQGDTRRGWSWSSLADGLGRSMELVNVNMPQKHGQNWAPSSVLYGTPGAANSVVVANTAPIILDVQHYPLIPRSGETITISARVLDETNGELSAVFYWRNASTTSPGNFSSVQMFDDGAHGDGVANDGIFGASLPPQGDRTVIEFYVGASDMLGNQRTWPAPALDPTDAPIQQANALLQVDDSTYSGTQPVYRIVMTETERAELRANHDAAPDCNATMNATFITIEGAESLLRYNTGVRNRGAGSRSSWPMNYRVGFVNDNRWKGVRSTHLNSRYVYSQAAGQALGVHARTDVEHGRPVQVLVNGSNYAYDNLSETKGSYMELEAVDSDYADQHFPDDSGGNVYRCSQYATADLSYQGENPVNYQGRRGRGYFKNSNGGENDWTDLINLCNVVNNTPDANYVEEVRRVINVEKWMRNLAFYQLVGSAETAIQIGIGDDYALYRGAKDPRFILLGHDLDTIMSLGAATTRSLFVMCPSVNGSANVLMMDRFMKNPEFAPIYYRELNDLLDTTFRPAQVNAILDQALTGWADDRLSGFKSWAANRYNWVRTQIPLQLTVVHSLPTVNNYLHSTSPTIALSGVGNAIETRRVTVNGSDATWTAWTASWTHPGAPLLPGVNYVTVRAYDVAGKEIDRQTLEVWYDRGGETSVGASTISANTLWTPAAGPYRLTGNVTIGNGATLTIQPGTTVYLNNGVSLIIANGGRLLAEGTEAQPIRFTRAPGSGATWGQIVVNGGAGSPETRISHARIEYNGATAITSAAGTLLLDHVTFGTTTQPYLSLDGASFLVQDCYFPSASTEFELVHGTIGIKSGGRGIFLRNYFGAALGYSDVIDFTGGNRPGQPIVQFINNVFAGSGDDHLDLDGTDAWVEGNIFLHAHKNGSPDTASAVSGGLSGSATSEVTMIGNIFYDCDQAAMAKEGNFYTMINNTIVRQTRVGGTDTDGAVICLADDGTAQGAGMYLEGNIIHSAEKLVRNQTTALVTFTNNIMPLTWSGPGGGNSTIDPQLAYVPALGETYFTTWAQAQVMKQWFSLQAGSPAFRTGPNFQDKGGVIPVGVSISGEPSGTTPATSATLRVGVARTGNGIPTAGWPNGSGYTHYKWRLDGGSWSAETPISTPITLTALANGPHAVEVVGKNDALLYQDDLALGADATIARSQTWVVQTNSVSVRLNEILARNDSAVPVGTKYPDLIELYNPGTTQVDLSGMSISDSRNNARKYVFPPGTYLAGGNYLVLYADNDSTPPGYHLGFTLKQEADDVTLYAANGRLVDSIAYGPQIPDLSIGRLADGSWGLTRPTFGAANQAVQLGGHQTLKINEWLARGITPITYDYVELFNPDPRPVSLAGLFLTDNHTGASFLSEIAPLSFIAGSGYTVFIADGNGGEADHLNFRLSSDRGMIALLDEEGWVIDTILYGPQTMNVSQGRSPNGSATIISFTLPTPGGPNQAPLGPPGGQLVINEILAKNVPGLTAITNIDSGTPSWIELYNPTANTIDLAGMSLSDTPTTPRKWVFPADVSMAPNSYRLVLFDPSLPASTTAVALLNTGFGIADNGGEVYLYGAGVGGAQLDGLAYGVQAVEYSIGRVPSAGTNWVLNLPTPGSANTPASLGQVSQLRVNEWMANPSEGEDWFEIYNPGSQPVDLSGLYLTDDLSTPESRKKFKVAPLSFIGTGLYGFQRFWADNSAVAAPDHCNFALRLSGEYLGIFREGDVRIDFVFFLTQDLDVSQGRLPDGSTNITRFVSTASPGDANYLLLTNVVINEVLSYAPAGWPLEQAIELRNLGNTTVNIGGWFLSNQRRHLKKFRITDGTTLTPGQFKVYYQNQFYFDPMNASNFLLDSTEGDSLYLSVADANANLTGYRSAVKFGAPDAGVSFGRYTNSVGQVDFTAMTQQTFGVNNPDTVAQFRTGTGLVNAQPVIGPLVFTEIMYHPVDLVGAVDNVRDEFLEIYNASGSSVQLFDPARPTNTWRLMDGVDFAFPPNVTLASGGYLLVVSFDPVNDTNSLAAFRAAYPQLAPSTTLFGPYQGKLDNGGERVGLYKPRAPIPAGQPGAGTVPYVLVEAVNYDDVAPWSPLADGTGNSLQRTDAALYGNDAGHWVAGAPTPGPVNTEPDSDGDGIPDSWMNQYFGHPTGQAGDNSLAGQDADGDGMSNLQEYIAGTHPLNASSVLRLLVAQPVPGSPNLQLSFVAQANQAYSIYYTDQLNPMVWNWVADVAPSSTTQTAIVPVTGVGQKRFFRVVTQ